MRYEIFEVLKTGKPGELEQSEKILGSVVAESEQAALLIARESIRETIGKEIKAREVIRKGVMK